MTVILTLTVAGSDSGPFDLYSNTNGYATAFEIGVTKSALEGGYTTSLVPDGTTIVKVQSTGNCKTSVNIILTGGTTTSTTTASVVCSSYQSQPYDETFSITYIDCNGVEKSTSIDGTAGFDSKTFCARQLIGLYSNVVKNGLCD